MAVGQGLVKELLGEWAQRELYWPVAVMLFAAQPAHAVSGCALAGQTSTPSSGSTSF